MLADCVRRGLAAGLAAGVLAGLFALLIGEVPIAEAIAIEEAAASSEAGGDAGFTVSRTAQQALLPVATALVGAALGGMFGLAYAAMRPRLLARRDWHASLGLGLAAWTAVVLLPGLKYPANPPAVGDPATVGSRSGWFLAALAAGVAGGLALWWLARRLRARGTGEIPRQLIVAATGITLGGLLLALLPANSEAIEIPASLLWRFRLAAIGTQTVLWAGIAVGFGLLFERARLKGVR